MKGKITILIVLVIVLGIVVIFLSKTQSEPDQKLGLVGKDQRSGAEFVCNHVQVYVKNGTDRSVIERYSKDLNGKIIADFPGVGAYSLFVPGPCERDVLNGAINFLKTKPEIITAEPESIPYTN